VVRATIKLPASGADLAIALLTAWMLRERPWLAIAAALAMALVPVTWFVSAWWGQFESIYALFGLLAAAAALGGRPLLAGVALGLAVATKPQALPFLLPFAAWILARFGWRGALRAAVGGLAAVAIAWLPFLPAGGHVAYLQNIAAYQDGVFAVMSLRAWNPWWILQSAAAGDAFLPDNVPILGPLTARMIGYGVAAGLSLLVAVLVIKAPTPRGQLLGAAAGVLVAFLALTTMHERYSFAALVFLVPLLADRRIAAAWAVLATATFANYLAAIPIVPGEPPLLPIDGPLGIVGSATVTGIGVATVMLLAAERRSVRTTARNNPRHPVRGHAGT
jgi:Gpi18-like mannosyltransferase